MPSLFAKCSRFSLEVLTFCGQSLGTWQSKCWQSVCLCLLSMGLPLVVGGGLTTRIGKRVCLNHEQARGALGHGLFVMEFLVF